MKTMEIIAITVLITFPLWIIYLACTQIYSELNNIFEELKRRNDKLENEQADATSSSISKNNQPTQEAK